MMQSDEPITPAELRRYRQLLGLSQFRLALLLGVSPSTWSRWESGAHRPYYPRWVREKLEQLLQERPGGEHAIR